MKKITRDEVKRNEPKKNTQTKNKRMITYIAYRFRVGPGNEEQSHTVCVTLLSGPHQRSASILQKTDTTAHKMQSTSIQRKNKIYELRIGQRKSYE